jgi:dTDP-4-dehydrorhamnose reductase
MSMRVLVTGVTGQVGGAIVSQLSGSVDVIAADRAMIDLEKPTDISAIFDRVAPDVIVNAAAYTAVDRAEDDRTRAFTVNADGPGMMARWAAQRGVPFIHFSTDYVFDGTGDQPWREDDVPAPLSVYGASKLAGEVQVRAAGGPHLVVRTSWVYAARGTNFLRTVCRLAAERDELRIVSDQIGAPTSASLISEALAPVILRDSSELAMLFAKASGVVNLAATGETSWYGLACAIVDGLKARNVRLATKRVVPIRTDEYRTTAVRPRNSRLNLKRLAETFGCTPQDWATALVPELDQMADRLAFPEFRRDM